MFGIPVTDAAAAVVRGRGCVTEEEWEVEKSRAVMEGMPVIEEGLRRAEDWLGRVRFSRALIAFTPETKLLFTML